MTERPDFLKHIIGGGVSSDLGSDAETVTEGETVIFPFLIDGENIIYTLKGTARKAPGTTRINSSALESGADIKGIFDLWFSGTTGSATQHRIIHIGTTIKKDDADGSFTNLFTGMEDGKVPDYSVLEDLLIIASDGNTDVPKSWDGTTAQSLAGSPPNFAFSEVHVNRLWAAGVASTPSRLHYSTSLNAANWTSKGSGFIDISPDDGDVITGLASHKDGLFVFKGPNKGSIHIITGTSPANFSRQDFVKGVGAVGHNTIFRFKDDIGFMWSDGSIRSLAATASHGDFTVGALSAPIATFIRENVNLGRGKHFWAANNDEFGYVLFSIAIGGSTNNNYTLMMDYRFDPPWWAMWPAYISGAITSSIDAGQNNRRIIIAGGVDGFVRKYNASSNNIDGITEVSYKVTYPFIDYGSPIELKTISIASLAMVRKNSAAITFGWSRDEMAQQTETFIQTALDGLDSFTLGTSALGGGTIVDLFAELTEGGQFRSIQYQIQASSLVDVDISSFSVAIDRNEGWSTE